MKLFEYKNYKVEIAEEALTIKVFKEIHDRDKTKGKEIAFKELAYLYHMCDLRSDFLIITNEDERVEEIKRLVDLPEDWQPDAKVKEAEEVYKQRTISPIMQLYLDAVKGALDTSAYLANAKELLAERDAKGSPIISPSVITGSINSINKTIRDLKAAEKEVIKEQRETEGRMKGRQEMSMFEEGLKFE